VVERTRELLQLVDLEERVALYERIGDVLRGQLGDPAGALGAYREAIELQPGNLAVLHKVLDVHTSEKQWRRAVEVLDAIAACDEEPRRRAKVHYTAAVIARDKLE